MFIYLIKSHIPIIQAKTPDDGNLLYKTINSMKVIFLDVDGVVCIKGRLMTQLFKNLKSIVENTNAKVVLSSNWRLYDSFFNRIKNVLNRYEIHLIGCTENINDARPYEIFKWVQINKPEMCVILDDRSLDMEKNGFQIKNCFIKTENLIGITRNCVERASYILNNFCLIQNSYMLKISRIDRNISTTYQLLSKNNKRHTEYKISLPVLS